MFYNHCIIYLLFVFFFFKQKTAYEMRISDWSSDVCSSDLTYALRAWAAKRQRASARRRMGHIVTPLRWTLAAHMPIPAPCRAQIGRASCRERVCQYV